MTVLARYPGPPKPATEEIALRAFTTAVPVSMTNRAEPGSGTDQRTVPGEVQSLGQSGHVSTEEPASGEAPGDTGAAQPAAIVTTDTATAVNQTRSRRCMSLTPPNVGISHTVHRDHSEQKRGRRLKVTFDGLPSPTQSALYAVSASSAANVWAGGVTHNTGNAILTMHFNGRKWTRVTSGQGFFQTNLFGVAAVAPNNVWAVGSNVKPVWHWNGTTWKTMPVPSLPGFLTSLNGATATSSRNAWIVGSYRDPAPA